MVPRPSTSPMRLAPALARLRRCPTDPPYHHIYRQDDEGRTLYKSKLVFRPASMHPGGSCMGLAAAKLCHAETCGSHHIGGTCALGRALLARAQRAACQQGNGKHSKWQLTTTGWFSDAAQTLEMPRPRCGRLICQSWVQATIPSQTGAMGCCNPPPGGM